MSVLTLRCLRTQGTPFPGKLGLTVELEPHLGRDSATLLVLGEEAEGAADKLQPWGTGRAPKLLPAGWEPLAGLGTASRAGVH